MLDRAAGGVTELAERSGISAKALYDLRNGRVASPRSRTVGGIAVALGVDPAIVRAAIVASRAAAQEA